MKKLYEVVDSDFNQANYPDLIGRVFENPPAYANVKVIIEKTPMKEIFRLQSRLFEEEIASDMIEDFVIKCLREGYGKEEIIEGIGDLFRQAPEPATNIFNRAVLKIKEIKPPQATSNNWYKKAQVPITDLLESQYTATVRLHCTEYGPNGDWEAVIDSNPTFIYDIELEHRSWGVKDINVSCNKILEETLSVTYFNEGGDEIRTEDRPISIDLSKLSINYVNGDGIFISDIDIDLNEDLTINYENSFITAVRGGVT